MAGQGQASPLLATPKLEGSGLKSGQAEAVSRTLTSTDTHQIIHGLSGVGKTTALGELARQLQRTGISIRAFSPTNDAAATLQGKLGIRANTVAHLVLSKPDYTPNQLWIVDEAGMVSARQMQVLSRKAEAVGARLLLVGDKGQNSSIESGSPLRSLIDNGATTHHIRQIIRQQNSIQRQAVELIADGKGSPALELLSSNGYVTELADRKERAQEIADQYLGLSEKERDKTLIVTGTNAERLRITKEIRTGLKAEGALGESVNVVQLVSRQLTHEQSRRVQNYQVGDYIKLHRDYSSTPLIKGQLYKVEKKQADELLVSSYGGRLYRFNPANYKEKEVSHAQSIEIAVGDQLRWTATDKKQGRINGKAVTVTALEGTTMSVKDSLGRAQEVSLLLPLAVDYNLVSTSYRAQSKSQKRVIVAATSDPTSSREPFYVQISRQTKHLSVYTQDLQKLRDWVKRSNAQQNPLELIGEQYGSSSQRTRRSDRSVVSRGASYQDPEPGINSTEQGTAKAPQQLNKDDSHSDALGTGELLSAVPGSLGKPQPIRDRPGNSGTGWGDARAEESADQLRVDPSRLEQRGKLRSDGNSGVQRPPVQQRLDEIRRSTRGADAAANQAGAVAEFPAALTDRIHSLADLVTEWRDQQSFESMLGQIQELAEQLGQRSQGSSQEQPHPYLQMDRATAALVQGQDNHLVGTQGLLQELQGLAQQLVSGPQHLESNQYETISRVTELLSAEDDQLLLQEQGLLGQLIELTQQLAPREPETKAYQYRNLDKAVDKVSVLDTEAQISEALQEINELVAQFNLHLEHSLSQAQTKAISGALQGWRAQQQLAEAVLQLGSDPQAQDIERLEAALTGIAHTRSQAADVERLVDLVHEWRDQQALDELIGQVQELAEHLSAHPQLQAEEQPYQFLQMEGAAAALLELQDNNLVDAQALVQELQGLTQQLALKQDQLTLNQYESFQKVTELLSTEDEQQLVQEQGLLGQLAELVGQLTPAKPGSEDYQYQNVEQIVEQLSVLETQAQVSAVLQNIHELLEQVDLRRQSEVDRLVNVVHEWQSQQALGELIEDVQGVAQALRRSRGGQRQEQSHHYSQMERTTAALVQGQDNHLVEMQELIQELRGLAQQLVSGPQHLESHQYKTIHRVTELLSAQVDQRLVQDSQLVEPMTELRDHLQGLEPQQSSSLYSQMHAVAELVSHRRAEDAISEAMPLFDEITQAVKQRVQNHPDLQQLAQTVRSVRSTDTFVQGPAEKPLQKLVQDLRQKQFSATPRPKKLEAFWQPGPTPEAPGHINPAHWQEWVEGSCIHPAIAAARLQSIDGNAVYDRLLSNKLATMGSGQFVTKPMSRLMKAYEQLADYGGWWTDSGVDPRSFSTLRPGESPQLSLYGTFKPANPRQDQDGKTRKYENPLGLKQELFERDLNFSTVPDEIAERIYHKYGVTPTPEEKASGFWYVVYKHLEIPIYRTEGNKKDAAITSQGRVVISGQGVNAGYRARDQFGDPLPQRVLHPQLEVFAQAGREIRFAFDQDSKLSTILNVRQDLVREAELLKERGCKIYSLSWDHHQGKGADDLIKNQEPVTFDKADVRAVPIEQIMKQHYRTKYNSIVKRVKRELGNISPERLDLEVYLQAIGNGDNNDGARFITQSDTARLHRKANPGADAQYVQAISQMAGTYSRLRERDIPNLDRWAVRAVQVNTISLGKEYEDLGHRIGRSL